MEGENPVIIIRNAGKPTADYDAKWGGFVVDGIFFTRLVYAGV
jgi:hypothetical protein